MNGWIFPKYGSDSITDTNGQVEAFWVAGSAVNAGKAVNQASYKFGL